MSKKKHRSLPSPPTLQVPGQPTQQFVIQQQSFSGPIPPPAILEGYERILPGAAERILRMSESQSQHRQRLEQQVITGNIKAQSRGQHYAFILTGGLFVGSIYLVANGIQIGGLAALVIAVGGIVSTFIYGRSRQEKERAEKQQQMIPRR